MDIVSTVDLVDIVDIMGYEAPLDALTKTVLADYHTCVFSRSISELSFYDVLSKNRAQFAIVGDGTNIKQYINGVLKSTTAHSNWASTNRFLNIGWDFSAVSTGYIPNFKFIDIAV